MSKQNKFFTRQGSNEGIRIPLSLPDGSATEEWLHILGADSDAFRKKEAEYRRQAFSVADKTPDEVEKFREEGRYRLLASLVVHWSFEEECTEENVYKFLREAPFLADQIDTVASRRAFFMKPLLTS